MREIEELEVSRGLKIRYFLENVASSPRSVIKHHNSIMEAVPVRVQASQFGWVHRNRLFWLGAMQDFNQTRMPAGIGFLRQPLWWDLVIELPKPIPAQLHMEKGFTLKIDPKANIQDQKLPRTFTFTREFPHPLDGDQSGTAQAVTRFEQDARRLFGESYEDFSLAWRNEEWQALTPSERAMVHGLPPDAVSSTTLHGLSEDRRTQIRNSWIGNGFHIPSLVLIMFMLVSEVASMPASLECVFEKHLQDAVPGSPFDEAVLRSFPGRLTADSVVSEVQALFRDIPNNEQAPWYRVRKRLAGIELWPLGHSGLISDTRASQSLLQALPR